jgi:hypothetical protein
VGKTFSSSSPCFGTVRGQSVSASRRAGIVASWWERGRGKQRPYELVPLGGCDTPWLGGRSFPHSVGRAHFGTSRSRAHGQVQVGGRAAAPSASIGSDLMRRLVMCEAHHRVCLCAEGGERGSGGGGDRGQPEDPQCLPPLARLACPDPAGDRLCTIVSGALGGVDGGRLVWARPGPRLRLRSTHLLIDAYPIVGTDLFTGSCVLHFWKKNDSARTGSWIPVLASHALVTAGLPGGRPQGTRALTASPALGNHVSGAYPDRFGYIVLPLGDTLLLGLRLRASARSDGLRLLTSLNLDAPRLGLLGLG